MCKKYCNGDNVINIPMGDVLKDKVPEVEPDLQKMLDEFQRILDAELEKSEGK